MPLPAPCYYPWQGTVGMGTYVDAWGKDPLFVKTTAGREEIEVRSRTLSPPMRTVLLMVDGTRRRSELLLLVAGVHAPDDALEKLVALGYIEVSAVSLGARPAKDVPPIEPAAWPPAPHASSAHPPAVVASPAAADAKAAPSQRSLYTEMSELVRVHLGVRGYFLQLKIEKANGTEEYLALMPLLQDALAKKKGVKFAVDTLHDLTGTTAQSGQIFR